MLFLSEKLLKNHADINILLNKELRKDGVPQIAMTPLQDSETSTDFNQPVSQ